MTLHLAWSRKNTGACTWAQALVVALSLGQNQIGGGEALAEVLGTGFEQRARRVAAVVDDGRDLIDRRGQGIGPGRVVEHGRTLDDRGTAPGYRQGLNQDAIEHRLAGVVRQVQQAFGLWQGLSQRLDAVDREGLLHDPLQRGLQVEVLRHAEVDDVARDRDLEPLLAADQRRL